MPEIPEFAIESLDHRRAVQSLGRLGDEASWSRFDAYYAQALRRLEAAGADFALVASNSADLRLPAIIGHIRIPFLNLFDEMAREAEGRGAKQVLILGTGHTMASGALAEALARRGIQAAGPGNPAARDATVSLIHDLHNGREAGARVRLDAVVSRAKGSASCAVCLACTELGLVYPEGDGASSFERDGVAFIGSTWDHIRAAFEVAVGLRRL